MVDCSDVYISFDRSEDTVRYSFVSHLCAAFRRRGISSFIRENGSDSESNGFSKLETSRASVVVFSEKYSSSKSCMEELVKVSERRRKNCLAVVPVFYPVTKSFMKKQIWNLGDVRSDWPSALLETVDLPGHELYDTQSDSDFVEEIVADVREKLNMSDNIGIYSKLGKIETLIYKQPWGVRSIGIWGMPGIGKTTLAKAAFDQLSGDYEASCFIKDFNKAFHEKGLYGLLEAHFGKILREELGIKSSITRPILLRNVLRHKRVLVVLDDVCKPLDAESFLGGFDWFCPGSLIIITSRDKQVFSICRVDQIYEVPGLNEEEALQLFSRCAFGKEIIHESLQKLSKKVIDYANGNPLALIFFGCMSRKNPKPIEIAFPKVKKYLAHEIHDAVKSTYDSLSSNEKNIFLDIACLFRGENVDCVIHLLEGCGFFPRVEINVLVEKCLVSMAEGRVVMHNLIQSIGRKIINGGKRRSRLWKPLIIKYFLEDRQVLGSEDIEAIFLDPSALSFDVNPMAFENMYNLRYLKICSSNPGNHYALHLPKGVKSLPEELRLLHWEHFPLLSLPQDFNTRNLVILNMCYSKLQRLWEGTKELGMLKRIMLCHSQQLVGIQELQIALNMEVIDLQGCARLQRFLATGHFQHLRVINLSGCIKIKSFPEVPPNIEELYLKQTGIRSIPTVTFSPQDNSFIYDHKDHKFLNREVSSDSQSLSIMVYLDNLKVLDLSQCLELEDIQGIPKNLRKLYLGGTAIKELPSLMHLSELVVLDLENCKRLHKLPMGIGNLSSLAVLNLSGCSELEDIQGIPRNLEELYLAGTAIQEVTSLIKHLSELVVLDLQNCKRLQHLPMEISNLKSLVTLKLTDPSGMSIREVSTSIIQNGISEIGISNLNYLLLTFNENAEQRREYLPRPRLPSSSLHGLVPRFYALVSLSLFNASLMHIPEEICSLPSVVLLDLGRNGFSKIPESIKQLSKLHSLRLRHCRNLILLPALPQSLKLLNVHGCVSLESVSWGFEQFPSHYTFSDCFNKSPKVARKRVVKGLAKVASIGNEHQQELIKALAFSICGPAGADQATSYNLRAGSFATIEITPSLRKTLLGFAIFVVVSFSDDSHNNAGLGVRCVSRWKTKKRVVTGKAEKVFRCWAPREAPEVQRDHMFVFYEDAEMHRGGGEGNKPNIMADHVEFEFQAVNGRNKVLGGNCMVTECDVCVITAATGAASLSVTNASKDMSLSKNHSPKLSSVIGKLRFKRVGRFGGCVCLE
ncbi:disease resistance-like protein [Arabidopsis thaliana]|uniref:Disease resistance protein (TIR-NBS-LRR class) family n=1 Tax=Arabidopsis thaliana TaxID=3702 RepID=Q9SCZ3_ARATH|nr:Disease resistance protein (TIR-NBS-LRR class) family [Arabidopsis thaliana]AEE78806.1 Disease resistance protein (TIR-NBS-LRR class) family [Arabidopsis thaliana]CAB63020.1 disease resistance-like protein [Arabidopsis thaliana]|eukprot:NP_190724.1 Disease resistance protein (TIR-NBS-LRR class) family [Arabidopsis thaliana]